MAHAPPALIFDCDGTLVDSEVLHAKALQMGLSEYGIHLTAEEIQCRSAGITNSEFLKHVEHEQHSVFAVELGARVEAITLVLAAGPVTAVAEAEQVTKWLSSKAIGLAVASNSSRLFVNRILQRVGLQAAFSGRIVTRDDVDAPKPAPDVYRLAAKLLMHPAADCVAVEDSPVGIRGARNAGMKVVAFRSRFSIFSEQELQGAGASVVIAHLRELQDLFR